MRKRIRCAHSVLFLLCCTLMLMSTHVSAQMWTLVEMEAPSEVEVSVEPGESNVHHVAANVTIPVEGPGFEIIWLSANSSLGEVSVRPPQCILNLSGNRTDEVDIIIEMPFGTSSHERPTIDIFASEDENSVNDSIQIHSMNVTILPFYRQTVSCNQDVINVFPGESTTFELEIRNTGNIDDNYTLDLTDFERLEENDITVEMIDSIAIPEGEVRIIEVEVRTSEDTRTGPHTIWITTESVGSGELMFQDYPLILDVRFDAVRFFFFPSVLIVVLVASAIGAYFLKKKG